MDGSSKAALMNGADIIVDHLVRRKVPYLFGLCGHGITGFMDAAFKAQNRIRTVSTHHEQTAGHMADAYYKVRGEPVATFTSCGPGSANLVVALAAAMMDSSAFLAITGNVPTGQFNRGPFQETGRHFQGDFPSVVRPYVKRSFQPTRADMVPLAITQAWDQLTAGRPGPVNLDVPLNVFVEETSYTPSDAPSRMINGAPGNPAELSAALDLLLGAKQPVIIAGQGVIIGHACDALLAFAERTGIPVVTSPNGKGAIPDRHALAFGATGRNGAYAANDATRNADVILAIGFSFDDRATSAWLDGYTLSIPPSRLIQIDIDPSEIGRNYPAEYGILGDAKASLEFLTEAARPRLNAGRSIAPWIARLEKGRAVWREYQGGLAQSDQMPLRPERLMQALSRAIPENARAPQLDHPADGYAAPTPPDPFLGLRGDGLRDLRHPRRETRRARPPLRGGGRRRVLPDDAACACHRRRIRHPRGLGGMEQQRLLFDPRHPARHVRRPRTRHRLRTAALGRALQPRLRDDGEVLRRARPSRDACRGGRGRHPDRHQGEPPLPGGSAGGSRHPPDRDGIVGPAAAAQPGAKLPEGPGGARHQPVTLQAVVTPSSTTTRFRPSRLARYSAASARSIQAPIGSAGS